MTASTTSTESTRAEVERAVRDALRSVAPEADFGALDPKGDLRDQLDIDSMDFLRVIVALHRSLGVDVPERDYAKLATFDGCVDYLLRAPRTSIASD
jgi:acyl carrier protein